MKIQLVVAQGVHSGKVIPVTSTQFIIGRDPQCNLRPASPSVSKQHCGIFVRGGKVVVKDYGSTNGTTVNGESVQGERELSNDDHLKIGPLEFKIQILTAAPPSTVVAGPAPAKKAQPALTAETTVSNAPALGNSDDAAAMFLAMDDESAKAAEDEVPEGTTAMDIPAMPSDKAAPPPKPVDSSKAAADILSKYMRRPRT